MSIRPATDTLRECWDGDRPFLDSLDEKYNALIRAIQKENQKGAMTIKLSIAPVRGDATMVTVEAAIESKPPKPGGRATAFYTTPESNTTTRNPRQAEIPGLRGVEADAKTVLVDEETGEIIKTGQPANFEE